MEKGYKNLKVYQMAYKCAMQIFQISKKFPIEERYSLTDQIRKSSRSVCTNIGEGYRKRRYPKHFSSKISDADGECTETMIWLDFAFDCNYCSQEIYTDLIVKYEEIGKMLGGMVDHPEKFLPKK
jgi:four helix bundle protein